MQTNQPNEESRLGALTSNTRGISPVIGVVLMIAVVIVLAAIIAAFVFGIGDSTNQPAPTTTFEGSIEDVVTGDGAVHYSVVNIEHDGGATITDDNTGQIQLVVDRLGEAPWAWEGAPTGPNASPGLIDLDSDTMTSGDVSPDLAVTDDPGTVNPGDTISVVWISPNGENTETLHEYTVPSDIEGPSEPAGVTCTVDGNQQNIEYNGEGTQSNPYKVSNLTELQCMENSGHAPDVHYELIDDIDASPTSTWNNGSGFKPIVNSGSTVHGNGHTISDLHVEDEGNNAALFTRVEGTVQNLNVVNADVTVPSKSFGGVIAGTVTGEGNLQNVHASGTVSTASTTSTDIPIPVGGVVGVNDGTIVDSTSGVEVTAGDIAGGLAGQNFGTIRSSSADGDVTVSEDDDGHNNEKAGGLVASNIGGTITQSSAFGDVTGDTTIGGLVGSNALNGTINQSYAVGEVTARLDTPRVGGVSGDMVSGSITGSYWATDTTGQTDGLGHSERETPDTTGVTAVTASEITGDSAATNMPAFNFDQHWTTVPGEFPEQRNDE